MRQIEGEILGRIVNLESDVSNAGTDAYALSCAQPHPAVP